MTGKENYKELELVKKNIKDVSMNKSKTPCQYIVTSHE